MKKLFLQASLCALFFTSCATQIKVSDVTYQSVRNKDEAFNVKQEVPANAKIYVYYNLDQHGSLTVNIKNLTDEIMIIDQTKSFVVNSGTSIPYYDPTVRTTTVTDLSSSQTGGSVNLGAVGGALGVGGTIGQILNGVNVGGSTTNGQSTSNTTYKVELPQVNIAPKGLISLKAFSIINLGQGYTDKVAKEKPNGENVIRTNYTATDSYGTFSVCISYSVDGGKTFEKIISEFYANSIISIPVKSKKEVNDALREIMKAKKDCIDEPYWVLKFRGKYNYNRIPNIIHNNNLYKFQ